MRRFRFLSKRVRDGLARQPDGEDYDQGQGRSAGGCSSRKGLASFGSDLDESGTEAFSTKFSSGGHDIRLDVHRPKDPTGRPALLLYHGSCSIRPGDYRLGDIAEAAASHGFSALLVHYFDRTGTRSANKATVLRHSARWIQTVTDALTFAVDQLAIDERRVAALGYSLGGFLAVAHAARDERVVANVIIAGGIDPFTVRGVKQLPPTLVIHGGADRRVAVAKAAELCRVLEKVGSPFATRIYPGESHVLSQCVTREAVRTAFDFLDECFYTRVKRTNNSERVKLTG